MIETSKQKLGELGAAGANIAKGALGIAAGAVATPWATAYDTGTNVLKAVPKAVGALTGLEAPTPGFNYSTAAKTTGLIGDSVSEAAKGFGVIGQNVKGVLKGVGFTEPAKPLNAGNSGAAINQPLLNLVKSGATPTTTAPTTPITESPKVEGRAGATSFNLSDKELTDWKARGDLQNSSYYDGKNPNDDKFAGMMKELMDVSGASPSAENSNKIKSLRLGIQALAPQTSYGQFGVAGLQTDTTKRGQDIESEIKKPYYEADAEESKAKGKLYGTQAKLLEEEGKPDKVREKEVSGWLTERRKIKNAALEGMTDMTPEEQDKRIAALDALFVKTNPAPPKKAKKNADGTVTVEYADGRVVTGILKK
jgi:hypothetical protein